MTGTRGADVAARRCGRARGHDVVARGAASGHAAIRNTTVPAGPRRVQPERRHAAGDRGADVDEVAVALGARAEHAVGEDDGVRLRPGDLLAEGRALVSWYGAHVQVSRQPIAM